MDWNLNMSPSSLPYANSHYMTLAAHPPSPAGVDANAYATGKQKGKRLQPAQVSKRPTLRDFQYLARDPSGNVNMLAQYVGSHSKVKLASRHAAQMVRESVRSSDFSHRLHEATISLELITGLVEFIHSQEQLKPEERGHLTLEVCFSSLTALMGDFSSGEIPSSDPNGPVVPHAALCRFRQCYPPIAWVIAKLVEILSKSINLYRRRRPPSASVVTKFQNMLRTLDTWNAALQDNTFQDPTTIIETWLNNHPTQVDGSRTRATSVQSPPNISETIPSPVQAADDSALLLPHSYAEPMGQPRRSSDGNTRSSTLQSSMANAGDQSSPYDASNLFTNARFPSSLTYYPTTTHPTSSKDMYGDFSHFSTMYDDDPYTPQSSRQPFYPSSMYSYRQG